MMPRWVPQRLMQVQIHVRNACGPRRAGMERYRGAKKHYLNNMQGGAYFKCSWRETYAAT